MSTKRFAVKTVYRTRLLGRPKRLDNRYQAGVNIIEERIVLFESPTMHAALSRAKVEGRRYSRQTRSVNVYGQKLTTEFLGIADCYEHFDNPGDSAEVWSACTVVASNKSNKAIVDHFKPQKYSTLISREFMDRSINQELEANVGRDWAGKIKK